MEIQGRIVELLKLQSGEGRNGTWRKQDYIIETPGQYPKKICFNLWGDKIDQFNIAVGDEVKVQIDIESREYNGRWYTDVRAWKVEKAGAAAAPPPADEFVPPAEEDFTREPQGGSAEDDLPF